jgi:hypothetical protein
MTSDQLGLCNVRNSRQAKVVHTQGLPGDNKQTNRVAHRITVDRLQAKQMRTDLRSFIHWKCRRTVCGVPLCRFIAVAGREEDMAESAAAKTSLGRGRCR